MMRVPKDKLRHFAVCCAISVCAMVLFRAIAAPIGVASLASLLISLCLGVGKEYGDMVNPYNKWDWKDLLADVIGAIVGTAVCLPLWTL